MTLGKKLALCIGGINILFFLSAVVALWNLGNAGDMTRQLSQVQERKVYLIGVIDTASANLLSDERGMLLRAMMHDRERVERYHQDFLQNASAFHKALEELSPMLVTSEGKQSASELTAVYERSVQQQEKLYDAASAERLDEARGLADDMASLFITAKQNTERLTKAQQSISATVSAEADSMVSRGRWLTIFLFVAGTIVGVTGQFVVRGVTRDLRRNVESLSSASEQVASASTQVAASSQALAQGASEQAASLEETSSSATEITAMTNQNAEHSKNSARLMDEMADEVQVGNRKLEEMTTSMQQISESSEKVSKVIKLIDEVAFQTNILALNAAVEAARAGEAGMGFAVVADEVRNLAQRCAQAAKETSVLIEDSLRATQEGRVKLGEVGEAIGSVTSRSGTARTLADEVSVGSTEQARGLEQITRAITQMEEVTHRNAASAEESAAAGQQLNSQSEALRMIALQLAAMVGSDAQHSGSSMIQ